MALPQQLKAARYSNSTLVSTTDNNFGLLETIIADILGLPMETDITQPLLLGSPLKFATIADETLVNPSSLTDFTKKYTIPANTLKVGTIVRVCAWGLWTNAVTDHLSARVYLGTSANSLVGVSGSDKNASTRVWRLEAQATIRTIGAAGTFRNGGVVTDGTGVVLDNEAVGTFDVDTTIARDVVVRVAVAPTANAGNSVVLEGFTVEIIPAGSTA